MKLLFYIGSLRFLSYQLFGIWLYLVAFYVNFYWFLVAFEFSSCDSYAFYRPDKN